MGHQVTDYCCETFTEYFYECRQNSRRCYRYYPPTRRQVSEHAESSGELSLYNCLESGDLADVEFSVECLHFPGEEATFKAHKMIMAVQNDVFRAMFYGNFAKEDRITITDLHPEGFRGLLRYFYSGRLDVASVHQAACTRTAAAKYLVPELEKKCVSFVNDHIKVEDVCPFLDYVHTMCEEGLDSPARTLVSKDSLGVICSSTFPSSTELTVSYILRHARNVSEASVVEAVYEWAQHQWLTRFFEDDERPDVRDFMLPLFPELRFLALTAKEFVEGPVSWKIFTDAEALAILSNIVKKRLDDHAGRILRDTDRSSVVLQEVRRPRAEISHERHFIPGLA
ncbi:hypothetical protein MTO96_036854 [Rhipicephalus appendiculatus]